MHDSIGDMIVDCLQNSVEANASRIVLTVNETPEFLDVCIEDNGKGMSDEELTPQSRTRTAVSASNGGYDGRHMVDSIKKRRRHAFSVSFERQPHRLTEDRRFAAGVFFNHDFQRKL